MAGDLILHAGGGEIEESNLALIEAPPPTETWFPVSHSSVLTATKDTLRSAGFSIAKQRLAVSHEGHRFFGVLDLTTPIVDGITLAVGVRNSTDKTFPIGFACGNRVFCCDNLAFTSEIVIAKKHTRYGETRFLEGIARAVQSLGQYQETAARWIHNLRDWRITPEKADSIILRAYEEDVIGARTLPQVLEEWRYPTFDEFRDGSAWSLWNAFTTTFGRTMQFKKPTVQHSAIIGTTRYGKSECSISMNVERMGQIGMVVIDPPWSMAKRFALFAAYLFILPSSQKGQIASMQFAVLFRRSPIGRKDLATAQQGSQARSFALGSLSIGKTRNR